MKLCKYSDSAKRFHVRYEEKPNKNYHVETVFYAMKIFENRNYLGLPNLNC